MLWLLTSAALAAPPFPAVVRPCATLDRLPLAPELSVPDRPLPPGSAKEERDPFGLPNVQLSENFRVSWGNSGGVSANEIDNLVESLEDAWSLYIDEMEHPQPSGTETWYFNIFIGDSGSGAPDGYGAGGYYTVDPDGYPMIVVAAGVLNDAAYTQITGSHEFYHAVQGSLNTYPYRGSSAWFWESSATWASAKVYPDNLNYSAFLFSYMLLPHLPVNFFDYPDTGTLQEYYQYGSFLWPLYLSEFASDWSLIRDAWTAPGDDDDPLESLRIGMAERGLDLDEAWLDHIARNQVWDYPSGDVMQQWVEAYAAHYSEGENLVAAEHDSRGSQGWQEGPDDLRPRRYGSNAIRMTGPVDGTLNVYIEGDSDGSESSDSEFGARLILVESSGGYQVLDVPFEGTWGELSTDEAQGVAEIWLVVGAWTERLVEVRWEDEDFGYRYALLVDESKKTPQDTGSVDTGDPDTGPGDTGEVDDSFTDLVQWEDGEDVTLAACACGHSRARDMGLLAIFMALLTGMRRRA